MKRPCDAIRSGLEIINPSVCCQPSRGQVNDVPLTGVATAFRRPVRGAEGGKPCCASRWGVYRVSCFLADPDDENMRLLALRGTEWLGVEEGGEETRGGEAVPRRGRSRAGWVPA